MRTQSACPASSADGYPPWVNHKKSRQERLGTLLAFKACDSESAGCQETNPPFSQDPE
jgi:hypothetical protein